MLRLAVAPAKLNLCLELMGQRPDGYHLLRAVSQTIDWSDAVLLELDDGVAPGDGPPQLVAAGPETACLPTDADNLAVRAATLCRERAPRAGVSRIGLEKRIPSRSGLGGGSADAAAVLRLLAGDIAEAELVHLALRCGADVPFALRGGAALIGGIGEELTPLPPIGGGAFVVALLGAVDTSGAYRATGPRDFSDGTRCLELAKALSSGELPDPALFGSGLEPAAVRSNPALGFRAGALRAADPALSWAMTGSGGAFFTYCSSAAAAVEAARVAAAACPGRPVRVALPRWEPEGPLGDSAVR